MHMTCRTVPVPRVGPAPRKSKSEQSETKEETAAPMHALLSYQVAGRYASVQCTLQSSFVACFIAVGARIIRDIIVQSSDAWA